VTIDTKIRTAPATADVDLLWDQFLEARATALQTLEIADAIAAGKAWAAFLASFAAAPPLAPE
jgi:hypothetical protein